MAASSKDKFKVYQHPALSAALTSNSLRPHRPTFSLILGALSASAIALFTATSRKDLLTESVAFGFVSVERYGVLVKLVQVIISVILLGFVFALWKAFLVWRAPNVTEVKITSSSSGVGEQVSLTTRQLGLMGMKPRPEQASSDSAKKPPKSQGKSPSPLGMLVPLHQPINVSSKRGEIGTSGGTKLHAFSTASNSPSSPSMYLSAASPQPQSFQNSPGSSEVGGSPWLNRRSSHNEITTEEGLERFLADVDEKISESASKFATPPPTINGFSRASPNNMLGSANTSGTARSTPLRAVRMSPGSQKFSTPPKKGDAELPPPMSMEESIEAFRHLGIYPEIESWRDNLRQWFSSVLLNPLLTKINTSHERVMKTAAKLGISVTISQVGNDAPNASATAASVSPLKTNNEWQPAVVIDEDGILNQLRATLTQALDSCSSKSPLGNFQQTAQQTAQQSASVPILQECIDAITEHQRLQSLMKGEWGKGLLPQNFIRPDYTVQRIRELAKGTCVKNYEYLGSGEVYDKVNKKWTLELPTDSHLLLYLFCAFLEHPSWMLHVDPTSYAGAQSSKNPLFLGVLPPRERFPEKYLAVIYGVPSVLHPGACVLAAGKQSPPVFVLCWDKKPQFSLQGRTALWDSILLLCFKIKTSYGEVVRGMHLGTSALGLLPVFYPDESEE